MAIRRRTIIWTIDAIIAIRPWETHFNEKSFKIQMFLFKKMYFAISSEKCRPFCLGLDVLNTKIGNKYRKTSNINRTLVGNKIVGNSDVVGASPVGAAPTTSSFST